MSTPELPKVRFSATTETETKKSMRSDSSWLDLLKEWKEALSCKKSLIQDATASATVLAASIPLSLGIAATIGVSPTVGLVSAIVGGFVGGLFGANRFVVTGPANAMAASLGVILLEHGQYGLALVAISCGLTQWLAGALGAGSLLRYIPSSVISGFTAGIGAIILCAQLPKILHFTPTTTSPMEIVLHAVTHISSFPNNPEAYMTVALGLGTFALTLLLPKISPKIPAHLGAMTAATLINLFFFGLPTVGALPSYFELPSLPAAPSTEMMSKLLIPTLMVSLMASAETLLTLAAMERQTHLIADPNHELVAQGAANIACGLFNSMPVCAVLARSTLNKAAGAKTRLALILQPLMVLGTLLFATPVIEVIPIVALAGIMLNLAVKLAEPSYHLFKAAKIKMIPWAVTFSSIMIFDLLTGVALGIITSYTMAVLRYGHTPFVINFVRQVETDNHHNTFLYESSGPLHATSVLSVNTFHDLIADHLARGKMNEGDEIWMDFTKVDHVDLSGAEQLVYLAYYIKKHNIQFTIINATPELAQQAKLFEWDNLITNALVNDARFK